MGTFTKLNLLLCCLYHIFSCYGASTIYPEYLIAPTKSFEGCSTNVTCVEFKDFLHNTIKYITSNSTIVFKPVTYDMSQQIPRVYLIEITGVTNVSIGTGNAPNGDPATQNIGLAQIKCTPYSKVVWEIIESQEIHIRNMVMTECSAEINHTKIYRYVETLRTLLDNTTLLLVHVTNITIKNIHATSSNGTLLLGIHIQEKINITNCVLHGTQRLIYAYSRYIHTTNPTKLLVQNSVIHSSLHQASRFTYQEGLTVIIRISNTDRNRICIEISNTSFRGHNEVRGFTLKLEYDSCSIFSATLSKIQVINSGMSFSWSDSTDCKRCLDQKRVTIVNSKFEELKNRAIVDGIPSNHINCFLFSIVNSTIHNSLTGLRLSNLDASLLNNMFFNNSGALYARKTNLNFKGENTFKNNINTNDFSAILLKSSTVLFQGKTIIKGNLGQKYAAVVAQNSTIVFKDKVEFVGNVGFYGGAISLYTYSLLKILNTCTVKFLENHARKSGGGIFVDTLGYENLPGQGDLTFKCFYYFECYKSYSPSICEKMKSIHFCNNTSVEGGDDIFGGSIDQCSYQDGTFISSYRGEHTPLDTIMEECNETQRLSSISSKANRLCFCTDADITCKQTETNVTITPGQTIEISAVAVGQRYGLTLATVKGGLIFPFEQELKKPLPHILDLQRRQEVHKLCTTLQYTINAPVGKQVLLLSISDLLAEDAYQNTYDDHHKYLPPLVPFTPEVPLLVHISLEDCSVGFVFNQVSLQCECHPYLRQSSIECVLNNQTIHRSGSLWVNASENSIIIHRHCPLGYCKTENMEVSLSSPDAQCSFDRSGTLCGQCRGNFSQVLGSLNCKECSDFWLFLVIPATLISGVILVLFLMTLNLTVSTGTINGLIFYANIVRANNAIFFSSQTNTITTISRVFIAWINLDIGIEVCFYNGLDAYAKTLFQLAFPLYICTIVAIIIISSHYSTLAAKLSGRNAVQVLATLFLLSYSKAIRLVITALSFTNLTIQHYPNNTNTSKPVWIYDGNVDYLQGKHIALFLIGILILVLVSLPYTTILLFSQCLQKISHYKGMSWVWKIKPLFDAYTGPYKNKHRYWTGLLLLVRVILYAIFSLNIAGDPAINLLAICILILLTMTYLMYTRGVYKSWPLDMLESVFLLNLALLSTSTLFAINKHTNQEAIINISVLISIAIFCGVTLYHAFKRIKDTEVFKMLRTFFDKKAKVLNETDQEPQEVHRKERIVTRQVVSINDLEEHTVTLGSFPRDNTSS